MILVDVNLLLYASISSSQDHERARDWLDRALNGPSGVGLPWHSLMGYLRISTNARAYTHPFSVSEAWQQVEAWLARRVVWVPAPGEHYQKAFGTLLKDANLTTDLVSDAHLAALAIEHDLTLCSTDRDFAKFPGLRWENPLAIKG